MRRSQGAARLHMHRWQRMAADTGASVHEAPWVSGVAEALHATLALPSAWERSGCASDGPPPGEGARYGPCSWRGRSVTGHHAARFAARSKRHPADRREAPRVAATPRGAPSSPPRAVAHRVGRGAPGCSFPFWNQVPRRVCAAGSPHRGSAPPLSREGSGEFERGRGAGGRSGERWRERRSVLVSRRRGSLPLVRRAGGMCPRMRTPMIRQVLCVSGNVAGGGEHRCGPADHSRLFFCWLSLRQAGASRPLRMGEPRYSPRWRFWARTPPKA